MPRLAGQKNMGPLPEIRSQPSPNGAWLGLILLASILHSPLQPAEAGIGVTISREPPAPEVRGNVTLKVQLTLRAQHFLVCSWYRGVEPDNATNWILSYTPAKTPQKFYSPAHTERETVGPQCSLHITGLRGTDGGSYTLTLRGPGYNEAYTMSVYFAARKLSGFWFIIAVVVPLTVLVCLVLLVTFILYKKRRRSGASDWSETPGERTETVPK